jgi:hypothetical protein
MKNENFLLYHYTNEEGVKGILEDQCLRATHYRYLNDESELIYSHDIFRNWLIKQYRRSPDFLSLLKNTNEIFDTILESYEAYILSFCKDNGNKLSQWRGYGKNCGYSIGFDYKELDKLKSDELKRKRHTFEDIRFKPVEYKNYISTSELREFAELIVSFIQGWSDQKDSTSFELFRLFFSEISSNFKHKGFKEENEYRFVVFLKYLDQGGDARTKGEIKFRNSHGTLIPYIELFKKDEILPIKKIIVGPAPIVEQEKRKKSIELLLAERGIGDITVNKSDIPYRG